MPIILGLAARNLDDHVTAHFTVGGLTKGAGWWPQDVEGEVARYFNLCTWTMEPARHLLGDKPMHELSGARFVSKRPSSMHFPPVMRASLRYQYMDREPGKRGAALDFRPDVMPCDEAFRILDAAQRDGRLPPGGLFWYAATRALPGPSTGRFVHIDDRGAIARERALTPPR